MSNPTVSFRISDYHLARGLRAIRILEPAWKLESPSDLIRTIFQDYVAKSEYSNKTPLNIDPALLHEIALCREGKTKQLAINQQLEPMPQLSKPKTLTQQELEDERFFNELKRESQEKQEQQEKQEKTEQTASTDEQINEQIDSTFKSKKAFPKPSEFNDPNKTESKISSVTDFSPPEEWKEEKEIS